jgi:hypothetical protein
MSFNLNILIEFKNKEDLEKTDNFIELNKISDFCFYIINCANKRRLAISFHMRDYKYKFLWKDLQTNQMVLDITGSYIIGNAEDILEDDYQGLPISLLSRLTNLQEFISEINEYGLIKNLYLYLADGDYLESNYSEISCNIKDFSKIFTEIINRQIKFAYKVKFKF